MNTRFSALALAIATTFSAGHALADGTAPKTRDQVKAELKAAQAAGDVVVNHDSGATARDINPSAYAPVARAAGKTRAEVLAELEQARRDGSMVVNSEIGLTHAELRPDLYPASQSREPVQAEAVQARQGGVLN